MRSSKSRSRSRSNRNKPSGNIINRVFDSSGPEGKVRGTPQQIIDKYNQLARDAQLSGDRVATENFQQHAEHYLRLLSEAQREQENRREEQERQNRERQAQRDRDRQQDRDSNGNNAGNASSDGADAQPRPAADPAEAPQPDVLEVAGDEPESGLVETPESKVTEDKPKRTRRKTVKKTKDADAPAEAADASGDGKSGEPPQAAE